MKNLYLLLMLIASKPIFAQITYVDYFDAVYPLPLTSSTIHFFDINGDGQNDMRLYFNQSATSSTTCCPQSKALALSGCHGLVLKSEACLTLCFQKPRK
jgi:hypothetical protein